MSRLLFSAAHDQVGLAYDTIRAGELVGLLPHRDHGLIVAREGVRSIGKATADIPANSFARLDTVRGRVVPLAGVGPQHIAVQHLVRQCQILRGLLPPLVRAALAELELLEGGPNGSS